jgi:hypothetical protein
MHPFITQSEMNDCVHKKSKSHDKSFLHNFEAITISTTNKNFFSGNFYKQKLSENNSTESLDQKNS